MSDITNTSPVVTENKLISFYEDIKPYLGGKVSTGFTPVGTVISIMSNHAPAGYLICDGSTYNIADYKELANHFATEFGSKNYFGGDGESTFAVPDLRGEFLRGTGTNSHENQGNGANVGTHQDGTEHQPFYMGTGGTPLWLTGRGMVRLIDQKYDSLVPNTSSNGRTYINQSGADDYSGTGADSGNDYITSRPTNTSVLYCIATHNMFMNEGSNYSTDEQIVGTWIDGKPIYQKTFTNLSITTQGEWIAFNHNISNFDDLIQVCSCNVRREGQSDPWIHSVGLTIGFDINKTQFEINSQIPGTAKLTIQYTKTTDV